MQPLVKLRRLPHGEGLPLPCYATDGAARIDLFTANDCRVQPLSTLMAATGFVVEIPAGGFGSTGV